MNSKSSVLNPQQYIESIRSRCDNIQAKGYIKSTNRTIEVECPKVSFLFSNRRHDFPFKSLHCFFLQGLTESIYTEAEKSWIFEILQNIRSVCFFCCIQSIYFVFSYCCSFTEIVKLNSRNNSRHALFVLHY